jgi:micrococcal nuclease
MFTWIRRNICCCIPIRQDKKVINIKEKQKKEDINKNKKNKKSVSFDTNTKYLQYITYKETIIFIPQIRFAKVIKVYDGDTITVAAKLPFDESPIYRFSVRLRSIDSPEIKGLSEKECQLACESKDALYNLIFGKIIELRHNGKEKYGRLLADVYYNDIHVNKWMVDNGYAVKYDGGKKVRGDDWD